MLTLRVSECNYDALYGDYRNIHGADEAIVDGADVTIPLAHPIYYYGQKYDVLKVSPGDGLRSWRTRSRRRRRGEEGEREELGSRTRRSRRGEKKIFLEK